MTGIPAGQLCRELPFRGLIGLDCFNKNEEVLSADRLCRARVVLRAFTGCTGMLAPGGGPVASHTYIVTYILYLSSTLFKKNIRWKVA